MKGLGTKDKFIPISIYMKRTLPAISDPFCFPNQNAGEARFWGRGGSQVSHAGSLSAPHYWALCIPFLSFPPLRPGRPRKSFQRWCRGPNGLAPSPTLFSRRRPLGVPSSPSLSNLDESSSSSSSFSLSPPLLMESLCKDHTGGEECWSVWWHGCMAGIPDISIKGTHMQQLFV